MTLDLTQVLMTLITVAGPVLTVIYTKQAKGHADSAYRSASMRPLYYKPDTLPNIKPIINPRINLPGDDVVFDDAPPTPRDPKGKP